MASKIVLELTPGQIETLVDKLSIQDKIRLVRKLERQTWAKRLDEVVTRVRKNFKKAALSDKEIDNICEEARQKIYNAKTKRSNRH